MFIGSNLTYNQSTGTIFVEIKLRLSVSTIKQSVSYFSPVKFQKKIDFKFSREPYRERNAETNIRVSNSLNSYRLNVIFRRLIELLRRSRILYILLVLFSNHSDLRRRDNINLCGAGDCL